MLSATFSQNISLKTTIEAVVRMAFERTLGGCRIAIIDWKGIRWLRSHVLLGDLKQMNVEIVRV